ncbi:hypothetical protein PMIN03_012997 [Paraphaeosphaeria minitans]
MHQQLFLQDFQEKGTYALAQVQTMSSILCLEAQTHGSLNTSISDLRLRLGNTIPWRPSNEPSNFEVSPHYLALSLIIKASRTLII